jgi:hypothetical protein
MIPVLVRFAVLAGLSVVVAPSALRAQQEKLAVSDAPTPVEGVDSARVRAQARSAQAGFERYRFHRLPRTHASTGRTDCDQRIGRFCWWFSDDPDPEPPPPEAPAIAERRRMLLNRLAGWSGAVPGDGWIIGQRVHYLIEAGDEPGAIAAAQGCRAEAWWCGALLGLALHEAGRFADAQAAFGAALAAMPEAERAAWTDVSQLLSPDDQRLLRRASAAEREGWIRRLWWLADPVWSDAGNDRLTEHYARWTINRIQEDARQVDRMRWRDDTREAVVRYGWFVSWKRFVPLFYGMSEETLVAYGDPLTWEWLPPLDAARDARTLEGDEWPLGQGAGTVTRYAPEYAARVVPLPHQMAVFPRRDGALLVAGYEVDAAWLPADARIRAALVAMADVDGARAVSPWQPTARSGALLVELPARSGVASLEVREDSTRLLARHRQAVAWDAGARISDLLLLADPDARPESLEEAARLARGSARVRAGERVGVFWEMYDLPEGDSMTVRVALLAGRAGWARRQLESLGIARGSQPARLRWREAAQGEAVAPRSLAVGIPAGLPPGDYALEMTVTLPGRPISITRRTVTVVADPDPAPPADPATPADSAQPADTAKPAEAAEAEAEAEAEADTTVVEAVP